ncbi:hypothetical protein LCGC14_2036250 [marine sediment metagenome]|uniref:Uncharacterized protein n=1 Tax=marine sediment metagenome TaxID=412755 RepID=A0A0F9FFV5_9ZZZZ
MAAQGKCEKCKVHYIWEPAEAPLDRTRCPKCCIGPLERTARQDPRAPTHLYTQQRVGVGVVLFPGVQGGRK